MSELQAQIPPYEYISGRDVTKRMKLVTNSKDFKSLGEVLGISKGTISTWHQRGLTPYEVILRLHLKTGASIRYLALGEGEPFPEKVSEVTQPNEQKEDSQLNTVAMETFCLSNGKLIPTGQIAYPARRINGFNLEKAELVEIETNAGIFLVDKNEHDPVSGNYLISIDGRYSINQIQRLPGKLAISFDGATIEVSDGDIKVVGRAVVSIEKK
jgi:hypothetical protein